ncbi:Protein Smaug-like 2, partial [Ophiophagus hannah]
MFPNRPPETLGQPASFLSRRTSGLPTPGAATACRARTAAQSSGPTHCPSTPPLRPSSCSHRVSKLGPQPVAWRGGVRLRPAAGNRLETLLAGLGFGPWGASPSLSGGLGSLGQGQIRGLCVSPRPLSSSQAQWPLPPTPCGTPGPPTAVPDGSPPLSSNLSDCQLPGTDLEINPTLESLCLSMTEHALGGERPARLRGRVWGGRGEASEGAALRLL